MGAKYICVRMCTCIPVFICPHRYKSQWSREGEGSGGSWLQADHLAKHAYMYMYMYMYARLSLNMKPMTGSKSFTVVYIVVNPARHSLQLHVVGTIIAFY